MGLCPYGNPGMAVGGMGDILAGVIGALMAQGISNFESAKLGVVLHSFAADEIARRQGNIGILAIARMPILPCRLAISSAANECNTTPSFADSKLEIPCAISAPMTPARMSPIPPTAIPGFP